MGKALRLLASEGWASGDAEIDLDWHERAVRLANLVAEGRGGADESVALAGAMLSDLRAMEGDG